MMLRKLLPKDTSCTANIRLLIASDVQGILEGVEFMVDGFLSSSVIPEAHKSKLIRLHQLCNECVLTLWAQRFRKCGALCQHIMSAGTFSDFGVRKNIL